MTHQENDNADSGLPIGRRRFLQLGAGGVTWLATGRRRASASTTYRVGVGKSENPYAGTLRAVEASGEWPSGAIAGKTVVIKPNLVWPVTAESGVVTDPEVVRAIADLAIEAGAMEVLIVEGGYGGPLFTDCGYDDFGSYDPRVRLVNLNQELTIPVKVPHGLAYRRIYMPSLLLGDDVVFISAGKLKTHLYTHATLSTKNLVGIAPIKKYIEPPSYFRSSLHYRGINQAILDLNLVRPIDYAVIDGIWAMEGNGPVSGDPVRFDTVLAGRNAVAVDRVGLWAMDIPQRGVKHLEYVSRRGLGPPAAMDGISVMGDPLTQRAFEWPSDLVPLLEYPRVYPAVFTPSADQQVRVLYSVTTPCRRLAEVVITSDHTVDLFPVRILSDWEARPAGFEVLSWDGRDENGEIVPPGRYTVRIQVQHDGSDTAMAGSARVWVAGP